MRIFFRDPFNETVVLEATSIVALESPPGNWQVVARESGSGEKWIIRQDISEQDARNVIYHLYECGNCSCF